MDSWSKITMICIIIPILQHHVESFSQQRQCVTKQVNADIFLDVSDLHNKTDMSLIRRSTIAAVDRLPINSRFRLTAIELSKAREIGTFIKSDASMKSFEQSTNNFNDYAIGSLNAKFSAVRDVVGKSMYWKDPNLADIVIIIGQGGVEYDSHERALRKKTFVIHTKDTTTTWDEMASDPDHVISPGGLATDTAELETLLCGDSYLLCDTDKYMLSNTQICLPCDEICMTGYDDSYCRDVCKYFRPPKSTTTVTPSSDVNTDNAAQVTESPAPLDPKMIGIIATILCIVIVLCVIWFLCSNKSGNTLWKIRKTVRRLLCCTQQQVSFPTQVSESGGNGIGNTPDGYIAVAMDSDTNPVVDSVADPAVNLLVDPEHGPVENPVVDPAVDPVVDDPAVDPVVDEREPLKCDDPDTNVTIVEVVEDSHIVLDNMVDLGPKERLANNVPCGSQRQ